jgi:hypothetical protein
MEGLRRLPSFLLHKGLAFLSFNDHCQAEYFGRQSSLPFCFTAFHYTSMGSSPHVGSYKTSYKKESKAFFYKNNNLIY